MNIFSITDLRQKTTKVIESALANNYVHIIQNSKSKVAMVSGEYLKTLQEAYEDYLDMQEFDRHINEPRISLDDYLAKYPLKDESQPQ